MKKQSCPPEQAGRDIMLLRSDYLFMLTDTRSNAVVKC